MIDENGTQNTGEDRQQAGRLRTWLTNNAVILTEVLGVTVSLLLLIVVAVQAWIYRQQLTVMRGQLNSMQATQNLLVQQTDINKKSLFVNRAYVGISTLSANIPAGQITLQIENVGKLPADRIKIMVRESRRVGSDTPGGSQTYYDLGQQIVPGSKMPLVIHLARFSPGEAQAIIDQKEVLFISGKITYQNGFGIEDSTTFGFEYIPKPNEGWTPRAELTNQ
jgi:hypothetical protein